MSACLFAKRKMQLFFKCLLESSKRPSTDGVLHVDPAVPMDLRRKPSSQESRTATRNTEPIVNSSETLSLDPFHRVGFEQGGPTATSHSHRPHNELSRHCLARAPPVLVTRLLRLSLSHSLSAAAPGCSTRQANCIFAGSNP